MTSKKQEAQIKRLKKRFSLTRIIIFLVIVAISAGICFGFKSQLEAKLNPTTTSSNAQLDKAGLSVHFIDVGQGDSIAIRFPDNKTMLIDAGIKSSSDQLINYLNTNFFEQGENTFDYLLLTHSDADHCGAMVDICDEFTINKIFRPKIYSVYKRTLNGVTTTVFDELDGNYENKNTCTTLTYYNTISAFNNETSNVIFTDIEQMNSTHKIFGDDYSIDFYSPNSDYLTTSAGTVVNDHSPIMSLNYNGRKIMFTGDASTTVEETAMALHDLPDVDILKVGHHGSATSTGLSFLQEVKPEHAIISCGTGNKYGHPTSEVLNRLATVGSAVYRTDTNGNIVANITSTDAKINIFLDVEGQAVYIRIEYIFAGIVLLSIYFCFGIKIKTNVEK